MHTFSQDGITIQFNADLSGEIYLKQCEPATNPIITLSVIIPAGFLQEWLKQAGFWLTPRLPEDMTLTDVDNYLGRCAGMIKTAIGMAADHEAMRTQKDLWKALYRVYDAREALPKEEAQ